MVMFRILKNLNSTAIGHGMTSLDGSLSGQMNSAIKRPVAPEFANVISWFMAVWAVAYPRS
jgi:hypothetical protein